MKLNIFFVSVILFYIGVVAYELTVQEPFKSSFSHSDKGWEEKEFIRRLKIRNQEDERQYRMGK